MSNECLKSVLQTVQKSLQPVAVVFDLDSTLFCVKYRTEGIIKDAVKSPVFVKKFSKMTEKFQKITVHPTDWFLKDIFLRHGMNPEDPACREVQKFWNKHFFRNNYLRLDQPYKGSVEYLNRLNKAGGSIFYLTGRNRPNMGEGTFQSLKKWKFPLPEEDRLILKPDPAFEDSVYKLEELEKLKKNFPIIMFFENEPVILHLVYERLPEIRLFWLDSAHSGKRSGPPDHVPAVSMDYTILF